MSREAIECFVDEIREEVPKIRRMLATIHACPEDRESLFEVHRLTHSIKGTALLVNIPALSAIALKQELLIERLMDGRLSMDDRLRDTLERLTDLFDAFADGLLVGNVPEQKLQDDATQLFERHVPSETNKLQRIEAALISSLNAMSEVGHADMPADEENLSAQDGDANQTSPEVFAEPLDLDLIEPLAPPISDGSQSSHEIQPLDSSNEDEVLFHETSLEHLEEMAHKLDQFRRDLTRWDLLADVRRRMHSLKGAASICGLHEFAHLTHHVEDLLQRLLDRTVPPAESAVDCLQACVDAMEQHLDDALDESILLILHERLDEICGGRPTPLLSPASVERDAANSLLLSSGEREQIDVDAAHEMHAVAESATTFECPTSLLPDTTTSVKRTSTDPNLIQLDDHANLSEEMLEVFTEEAEDHLRQIYAAFTGLESHPAQMSLVQDVRRSAHTIKGAAGSVGLRQVSKLSHRMEDLLEGLFESQQPVASSTLTLLYDTTDTLQDLVHGNYVPAEMKVAVAQLYDSYDIVLNQQAEYVSTDSDSVLNISTTTELPNPEISEHRSEVASEACAPGSAEWTEPIVVVTEIAAENEVLTQEAIGGDTLKVDVSDADSIEDDVMQPVTVGVFSPITDAVATENSAVKPSPSDEVVTSLTVEPARQMLFATAIMASHEAVAAEVVTESRDEFAAPAPEIVIADVLPMLAAWSRLPEPVSAPSEETNAAAAKKQTETLRVPLDRIDSLVREVGELIINRTSFAQRMADFAHCVEEIRRAVERLRGTSNTLDVKYGVGALGGRRRLWGDGASLLPTGMRRHGQHDEEFDTLELDRYSEFHLLSRSLAETTTDIGTIGQELQNLMGDFDQLLNRQGRLSRGTQDRLMRIRMVPLAVLTTRLHRTVRVVAGQQDKLVDFLIQGGETEFDKLALEELADPLMHILRNAVDHGIEMPDVRLQNAKPQRATIRVQASYQSTQAVICIHDDGRGLDLDAIRETAIRNGLVTFADVANFTDEELAAFIFLPGFSTARELSEVSGRGVGMDIVRDKVLKLKGSVSVESQAGQGTTFTIRLPMTLAMTRALLVHASNETFAIPMRSVTKILRLDRTDIEYVEQSPVIRMGEATLPLVYLCERLKLRQPPDMTSATLPVLVVASGDEKVAVVVDKILPGRDIVVKTLGTHLRRVRGLIGATLMGDGSVVPILDAADLVGHAGTVTRPTRLIPESPVEVRHEQPVIMVVDDSVSVRRVMMNLLKKAGWIVIDAKDGLDAIDKLHQAPQKPDLLLLDIEMPRMDGYELLGSLRSQDEYCETPIVMVTSRSGDKHRNKAMQLGATDYVVKPYQDDQLLSLIRRLLMREPVLV